MVHSSHIQIIHHTSGSLITSGSFITHQVHSSYIWFIHHTSGSFITHLDHSSSHIWIIHHHTSDSFITHPAHSVKVQLNDIYMHYVWQCIRQCQHQHNICTRQEMKLFCQECLIATYNFFLSVHYEWQFIKQ